MMQDADNMKKVLAITYALPDNLRAGDYIYTYYLFKELAKHVHLTVVGQRAVEVQSSVEGWVQQTIAMPAAPKPPLLSVFSKYPNCIFQNYTKIFREAIRSIANKEDYSAIICDQFKTYWAAETINAEREKAGQPPLPMLLMTHNYDSQMKNKQTRHENNLLKRLIFFIDELKVRKYEKIALLTANEITAITEIDAKFISQISSKAAAVIKPGYSGYVHSNHQISDRGPRRAAVLGSFYTHIKQQNLIKLIEEANQLFSKTGTELLVVGDGPKAFFDKISKYKFVQVTGRVESPDKHLHKARIAIIAELVGGGFKYKALNYVFNKIPMAVLRGTMAGLPLQPNKDYFEYSTLSMLAGGVVQEIDDIDKLNTIASNALAACRDEFSWQERGKRLFEMIDNFTVIKNVASKKG